MILRLTFDLPESFVYISHLRKTACCFMASMDIGRQDAEDVELLIGELAANAVRHGQAGQNYQVIVEFFHDEVTVTVVDRGTGFPTEALAAPGTARHDGALGAAQNGNQAPSRFGGWGLPVVYSLSDSVEILPTAPRGTTVRATKRVAVGGTAGAGMEAPRCNPTPVGV